MPPEWGGHVRSRDKLNTLYLHLQKTHEHQIRQGADLQWEASILQNHVTHWSRDQSESIPRDNFKNSYFLDHKSYDQ